MCFGPSAPIVSRRRRALSPSSPPRIAAWLHIDKPGERQALDRLHSYTAGRRKIWRVLAIHRDAEALRVAVEWPRRRSPQWFALVTFAFADGSVSCRFKDSAKAARAALAPASGEGGRHA